MTLTGKLGRATVNILLDSGSSISLVRKAAIQEAENVRVITPTTIIQLVKSLIVDYVTASIQVWNNRAVVNLITAVILVMQKHGLVLNFSHSPVQVLYNSNNA